MATGIGGDQRWRLEGKTALVTGGTKGIGKAIVEELASLGCRVIFCARSADDVQSRAQEWTSRGLDVQGLTCDISTAEARQSLISEVGSLAGGKLDILVNNAGINVTKPTVEYTEEEYDRIMTTNLKALYNICQLAQPLLQAAGRSSVVNVGSVAGVIANRSGTVYAMSKAAISQLGKNLACEWAKHGIRVNTVAPWFTYTPLNAMYLDKPEFRAEVEGRTPMGRTGQVEEISGAVAFLCLPPSSYITGQTLAVDGGFTIKGLY